MSRIARDASGRFFATDHQGAACLGIAKATLRRVLTHKLGEGVDPTAEEIKWAIKVIRERPEWAEVTLKACGV